MLFRSLDDLRAYDNSFFKFAMARTEANDHSLRALGMTTKIAEQYTKLSTESLIVQRRLEQADPIDFETYRLRYLASDRPAPASTPTAV